VIPKVLGAAVGLTPLTLLFSAAAVTWLFGGFAVILAIPFVAVLATIIDVIVFNKNPAEEGVPTVLFPAEDAEN
jgi:predicted PurR-regulated permease PerM